MPIVPTILKDPQLNLSKKDRAAILKQAANNWFSIPKNIVLYVSITVFWMFTMFMAGPLALSVGLSKPLVTTLIWVVLYPLMFVLSYYIIFNYNFLPHLYQELRARQHNLCPKCGYILIDLPESETKCPECGTLRTLLPAPKQDSPA